ncbi:MAG: helix-turn-helix domain-containing protein [Pirellulales bacterium]
MGDMHEYQGVSQETRVHSARDLGHAIRHRRKDQRLTQDELALLAGGHRNRIQELEKGIPTERVELLLRVLHELGLDLVVRPRDSRRGEAR